MNTQQLESEINDVRGDITSLESEILNIQKEHDELQSKLLALQQETEQDELHDTISKEQDIDNQDIPAIIQHSHFDPSISKFFTSDSENRKQPAPIKPRVSNFIDEAQEMVELKENILYENIFRIGGITAFPLNPYLFAEDDEVLGLRFDIFSHTKSTFVTPHYIILRKVSTMNKQDQRISNWSLHRHTVPVYVPLETLIGDLQNEDDNDVGLANFATSVRRYLILTQYKHDKIDELEKLTLNNINSSKGAKTTAGSVDTFTPNSSRAKNRIVQRIDKDLQCQRILLQILNRNSLTKKTHQIELNCTDDRIEFVKITLNDTEISFKQHTHLCEELLRDCKFEEISKTIRGVFEILITKNII